MVQLKNCSVFSKKDALILVVYQASFNN